MNSVHDRQQILAFIAENYPLGAGVDTETELVRSEIIDSYGIVQMIEFLEGTFKIDFPDDEITPDNFRTAVAIASCVDRIRAQN